MLGNSSALNTTACGDWIAFKDEKCIKILKEKDLQNYDNAKSICLSQFIGNPSLIMINSKEEQQFIENLLFDQNKIVEDVWLGAKRNPKTKTFHWDDVSQTNFTFENWGKLNNHVNFDCVEMVPYEQQKGKWTDTACNKKNIVVCQKQQDWTLERLKKQFLEMKKQNEKYENQISKLENNSVKFENEVNELKQTFIPIGFIYVHLPNQTEPTQIWPKLKWQEITSQYANLFFRAEGNWTAPFGQVQEESSPRLSIVNLTFTQYYINKGRHAQLPHRS